LRQLFFTNEPLIVGHREVFNKVIK